MSTRSRHTSSTAQSAPGISASLCQWIDAHAASDPSDRGDQIDVWRVLPFIALHLACFAVFWVGISATAVTVALATYGLRMFAITGFYHRYFSHKAFKTHRSVQWLFACLGASSAQRGPLWWAAHHRHHHRHADTELDLHSPRRGFWRSHMGWFLTRGAFRTNLSAVPDLARFPELRFLDRFDLVAPAVLVLFLFAVGEALAQWAPGLGTDGLQLVVWGFVVSTVVLFHITVTINSLAHRWGSRRFETRDDSRNNLVLAMLTFGEGWHNNHHHFPGSARQGFRWWELDVTYFALRLMAAVGLVWDLKPVPTNLRRGRQP